MADYATLAALKSRLGLTDTTHDGDLAAMLTAASRAIDGWCNRADNAFVGTTETRVFDVPGSFAGPLWFTRDLTLAREQQDASYAWSTYVQVVDVDSFLSVTSLKTDDGSLTYPFTWVAGVDYDTLPINAGQDGLPFRQVRALPNGSQAFTVGLRTLQITGLWGEYAAAPPVVSEATLLYAGRLFARRKAPFGVAEFDGIGAVRIQSMDPDIKALLHDTGYVRRRATIV